MMALTIIKEKKPPIKEAPKYHQADRRLYLTADKKRLVEHGDPTADTLYAAVGDLIPMDQAKRFGLIEDKLASERGVGDAEQLKQKAIDQSEVKKKVIWPSENKRLRGSPIPGSPDKQ